MSFDIRQFLFYVIPATVGMVVSGSFNIVDTIFVGQAAGKLGLAATALTQPIGMAIFAFGGHAGTGGAILVMQAKAAGEPVKAPRLFSATLALLLAMSSSASVWA